MGSLSLLGFVFVIVEVPSCGPAFLNLGFFTPVLRELTCERELRA